MGGEWVETTIGDQVTLQRGFDITRVEQNSGNVPVISSGGISSHHDRSAVEGPGVVLGRKGVVGSVFYVDKAFWPHDTTLFVKNFKGNNPRFVFYFFRSIAAHLASLDVGSANPTLNRNHVHPRPTRWPEAAQQIRIADLLGALDDKIEMNRRMAETLEGMARALFRSWFVDFDPVRAKADGRPTGLPDDLAALFPDKLGENGMPEGWTEGSIADLAAINPTTPLTAKDAPYIDMAALPTTGSRVSRVVARAPGSGARFRNGDTLVARITPCLENGKTALIDCLEDGEVAWGSTEFIVLRPNPGTPPSFPYLLARHQPFRQALIAAMSGTSGRQRVQAEAVTRWPLAIPTWAVLSAFAVATIPLFDRLTQLGRESETLAALRDTLLPKLISGELRVADAEQRIAEVA